MSMNTSTTGVPEVRADESITKSSCDVCSKIIAAVGSPESKQIVVLGNGYQLLESHCTKHYPIIKHVMHEQKPEANQESTVWIRSGPGSLVYLLQDHAWSIFKLATSEEAPSPGPGRLLSRWIDGHLLRQWKHGCTCELVSLIPELASVRPRLLIDTVNLCLKWTSPENQYLALSYVWCHNATTQTTTSTFKSLCRPGSFDEIHLPATIKHAILLTIEMDERYLWVDALCIIQDDETFRDLEIHNMAGIYSNARITIIAASGPDSAYGLRGIRGGLPREPLQVYKLSDSVPLVTHNPTWLSESVWASRAWTFQEGLVSTRKIIFKDETVEWSCFCADWQEYDCSDPWTIVTELDPDMRNWNQKHKALFNSTWPVYQAYQGLVFSASPSNVSIPEDIYSSFMGITSALSKSFHGGFNFGLPITFFDAALIWDFIVETNGDFDGVPKRRIPIDANKKLPSWSWMGWDAWISTTSTKSSIGPDINQDPRYGDDPGKHTGLNRLVPVVKWHIVTELGENHSIESTWDMYREAGLSVNSPLPQGWTRHQNHPHEKTQYYTTLHAPGEEFMYPFPLAQDLPPLTSSKISSLIACRPQRCFLAVCPTRLQNHTNRLLDEFGTTVGYIQRIKTQDTNDIEPTEPSLIPDTTTTRRQRVELVAISRGTSTWQDYLHYKEYPNWEGYEHFKENTVQYYNVLSIWWKDGVAYRDGLGTVFKNDWDKAELETIDLVLG